MYAGVNTFPINGESIILVVGEDAGISRIVGTLGLRPVVVERPQEALTRLQELSPSVVLFNLSRWTIEPGFLHILSRKGIPLLVLADSNASSGNIRLKNGRNGKVQVLARPLRDVDLRAAVRTAIDGLREAAPGEGAAKGPQLGDRYLTEYAPLFLHSRKMQALKDLIEQVADTNASVLIRGESGVGKDIVARAIHYASPRHRQPFVKMNSATFPVDLLESELFGHEKGAFTGAHQRKLGKFEFANKGTFFLDEVGELPVALQAKLLHVLQDQAFSRLGGLEIIQVEVRVIASTNRNLEIALRSGQFREDLYYRLNVVEVHVPPLRERKEEIPLLAISFLDKFNRQYGRRVELPPETIALFSEYLWPGNVRELENVIRRLVVLENVQQIHKEMLTRLGTIPPKQSEPKDPEGTLHPSSRLDISPGLREVARRAARQAERKAIQGVLDRVHWNRAEAARRLRISYKTLLSRIDEVGLASKQERLGSPAARGEARSVATPGLHHARPRFLSHLPPYVTRGA